MAQDPEHDDSQPEETQPEETQPEETPMDTSHDMDMVAVYESQTVDAEIEADVIRGLLESNGVPALVVSGAEYPVFGCQVRVPHTRLEEARRVIAEAEAAGPDAAAEAEASSEGQ